MRIGIDFDNTIACYDGVFHRAAVEQGLIPPGVPTDKTSVRDYFRSAGREDAWTELQGHVYGARMDLVACYPGVDAFLRRARAGGHTVFVISHKTRTPYLGEPHDLHTAAVQFLQAQQIVGSDGVPGDHVFFELTLPEKLARIRAQGCDVFIDDLPELLAEPAFPSGARPILFDPDGHYPSASFETHRTWDSIAGALLR
jgi:hypothetical protein